MPLVTAGVIAIYVAVQIAIGVWIGARVKTASQYYTAGGRLGAVPIALSLFATWFGAESVLGSSAAIAEGGLGAARAEPFGYAICLFAMGYLVARPFRERGYATIAAFFKARFDRRSELAAAMITALVSIIWAAAQLLALSAILSEALHVPASVTLVATTVIVIAYASLGGLASDIAADVIQGSVLLIGLIALLIALSLALADVGGILGVIEPDQLRLVANGENWLDRLDSWAIPVLGSLVTQEAIARFSGARDGPTAVRGCLGAAGLYLIAGMIPVLIALAGVHALAPDTALADRFLPHLIAQALPPVWSLVLIGALLAAILSTVDSNFLSVSALVTGVMARAGTAPSLWTARGATVLAGFAAFAIAANGSSVYELIAFTSILGQGGLLVAVLIGLYSQWGGASAALTAIFAGSACNVITYGLYPLLVAKGANGLPAQFTGGFLLSILVSLAAYGAAAAREQLRLARRSAAPL